MSSADLAVSGRLGTSSLRARPWATVTFAEARSEIAASGWRITSWVWSVGLQSFGTARLEIYRCVHLSVYISFAGSGAMSGAPLLLRNWMQPPQKP